MFCRRVAATAGVFEGGIVGGSDLAVLSSISFSFVTRKAPHKKSEAPTSGGIRFLAAVGRIPEAHDEKVASRAFLVPGNWNIVRKGHYRRAAAPQPALAVFASNLSFLEQDLPYGCCGLPAAVACRKR